MKTIILLIFLGFPTKAFTHDFQKTLKKETVPTTVSINSRIDSLILFGDSNLLHERITNDPRSAFEPVQVTGEYTLPPIHIAAKSANIWAIKLLVHHGVDVHTPDSFGLTPLQRVVFEKYRRRRKDLDKTINELISMGAEIDLAASLDRGDVEKTRSLLSKPPWLKVNKPNDVLFDGKSLDDWWVMTDGWQVLNGRIVAPNQNNIQYAVSRKAIYGPFELKYMIQFLGRGHNDCKNVGFLDSEGKY